MTGIGKHSLHLHITRRRKAKESSETGIELLEDSAARKNAKQTGEGWESNRAGRESTGEQRRQESPSGWPSRTSDWGEITAR